MGLPARDCMAGFSFLGFRFHFQSFATQWANALGFFKEGGVTGRWASPHTVTWFYVTWRDHYWIWACNKAEKKREKTWNIRVWPVKPNTWKDSTLIGIKSGPDVLRVGLNWSFLGPAPLVVESIANLSSEYGR